MPIRRRPLAIPLAAVLLWLSSGAVTGQPTPVGTPEDEQANALFRELLKNPTDVDINFRYAEAAVKLGNYEGAISALERLLLYNPNFPGVKLQLAELYTRLGSYTAARAYIDQVEKAPEVTAETRARVQALRAQIERASSPSQFAVNLVTGLRHQSNISAEPAGADIVAGGIPLTLSSVILHQPGWDAFLGGNLAHSYDLGGVTLQSNALVYYSKQFHFALVDSAAVEVNSGPRFEIGGSGAGKIVALRPYALASEVLLGNSQFVWSVGAGLSADRAITERIGVAGFYEFRTHPFANVAAAPTATDMNAGVHAIGANLAYQALENDWDSVIARVRDTLAARAASVREAAAQPTIDPAAEYSAAMAHYTAGRLDQAEATAKAILDLEPDHAGALHLTGIAEIARSNHRHAAELLKRSIAIAPDSARTHNNLGIALSSLGKADEAIECFRRAVALDPNLADAHANLGRVLQDQKRLDEAVVSLREAGALRPDDAAVIGKLGTVQFAQDNLGEAAESFRRALALNPNMAEAENYLGLICRAHGRLPEAIEHFRRAIAYRPDFGTAHFNLGVAQLILGDFANGWREYEWRWQTSKPPLRKLPQPLWTGEDLGGETILLHHEQGLGDTIQFMRYAPLVAARGAGIVLELQPALVRLAAGFQSAMEVVGARDPLPPFDFHCPLLSLPERFATDLETIPLAIPYLVPEPEALARWRRRLPPGAELKIGVAWAGNPTHQDDRNRSLPIERLLPLFKVPGLRWFSLQVGERAGDIARLPGGAITDLSRHLTDLAETAAALANLDLVIAVDTSVVHLAGALGRPAWVLLPFSPDWRWMLGRDDSPWYPSLRLFRQERRGDWDAVVERVKGALARQVSSRTRLEHEAPPAATVLA